MKNLIPILAIILVGCSSNHDERNIEPKENQTDTAHVLIEHISPPKDTTTYLEYSEIKSYRENVNTVVVTKTDLTPFDTLDYDQVIAFDFRGHEERNPSIKQYEKVVHQSALSQVQSERFIDMLTSPSSYGSVKAACFEPHLGVIFYHKGKAQLVVDICLDCNTLHSSIPIPAIDANDIKEGDLILKRDGFSLSGQQHIIDLCAELGLDYGNYSVMEF